MLRLMYRLPPPLTRKHNVPAKDMFGAIAPAVLAGAQIALLVLVRLTTRLLVQRKTANGVKIPMALPGGVHQILITNAQSMIRQVARPRAASGAYRNTAEQVGALFHLKVLPAPSTTKPLAHPKDAVGVHLNPAARVGAL